MKKTDSKETKQDAIKYFKDLSYEFEKEARRANDCPILKARAEAYELAAFHLEKNVI